MINQNLALTGGIDRTRIGYQSAPGTIFQLRNLRHAATQFGRLEQTPYFTLLTTLARGTYYDGGSQTEPATSNVMLLTNGFYMTQYCFSTGSAQIKAFYQTTQPTTTGVTGGCLLVINSIAGLAINLGSTLDIVIDGATTFKWRKNGGAYTTLVPITTTGVSIDGGNATVYFLASSGFTVADTWSWTRTDKSSYLAVNDWRADVYEYYKGNLYFTARDSRVMVAKKDSSNVTYVISLGYRAVYGQFLAFFYDHLMVGGYGTSSFSYLVNPQGKTIGWSDVTDVENFIATDTNEADTYTLPNNHRRDVLSTTTTDAFITGIVSINESFYVLTTFGMWRTSYLGLPLVFSFETSLNLTTTQFPAMCVARSQTGAYILTQDDIVHFDGSGVQSIGVKVADFLGEFSINSLTLTKFNKIFYNASLRELCVITNNDSGLLVYQEKYGTWYWRSIFDSENLGRPTGFGIQNAGTNDSNNLYLVGLGSRRIWIEDITWSNQPAFDDTSGTTYTKPTIIFHPFCGEFLSEVKECIGTYIGASLINFSRGTETVSSTYYSTGTNIRINVSWSLCPAGFVDMEQTYVTDSNAYWDSSKVDGDISYPRIAFRGLAIKLEVVGQVPGKPPGFINITSVELLLRGAKPTAR